MKLFLMGNILLRLLMRSRSWGAFSVSEVLGEGVMERFQGTQSALTAYAAFFLHTVPFIFPDVLAVTCPATCCWPLTVLGVSLGNVLKSWVTSTTLVLTSCMRDEAESKYCSIYRRWNEFHMLTMEDAHVCTVRTFPGSIFNFHAKCRLP